MLTSNYSSRFKKDLKVMQKRGADMRKIFAVMLDLQNGVPLQPKHREHQLQGNYKGYFECHIEPDWLMVYRINRECEEIYFTHTGTHADLFE